MDRPAFLALLLLLILSSIHGTTEALGGGHPCCPEDRELSYLLHPKPTQSYSYLVRYETFFSTVLGKEKGFFVILPIDFYQNPKMRYPHLYLLHGYNFHRRGWRWKAKSPEEVRKHLCEAKEEEYHWLLHEDIAVIAYAMMDSKNRTYRELQRSLEDRFYELSIHGGLLKEDYHPREIAQSLVLHNLHPGGNLDDPFQPILKMVLVLPDGDNGFYTDENEGRRLFPETENRGPCDGFHPRESWNYSLFPFLWMQPGALGQYETYFLELVRHLETRSPYRERLLPVRGIGGMSMGGFGAMKLGLKYPDLFHSISSQSGLLDLELLRNRWTLKMVLPEFLEVFGRLDPKSLPPGSRLDLFYIASNNPLRLLAKRGIKRLPPWIYFDYGEQEGYPWIVEGNRNFEKALAAASRRISAQAFNGTSQHNYQFWRSRAGNMLRHHSEVFRGLLLGHSVSSP
ncbi:MAG: alpha/beta hydrolase-fold protein [Desulfobacterota bacterium]|nr:alpha/beta hydrolase-fold protein [Thermodesulfobacteriota bacterium]